MNGLLDYFKGNARNLWGELKAAPQELKDLFTGKHNYQIREAMKRGGQIDPNVGAQYAMDFLQTTPVGALGKIVYHGSPHKFNRFDMGKIGTGEGAQAYGHGLYFAEAPEVAKTYGKATTPGSRAFNSITYNGQNFPAGSRDGELLYDITTKGRAAVIQNLQKQADRLTTINPKESANLLNRIEYAKTIKPDNVQIDAGNLYKVDIPDESIPRMLDWDKPLSEQSPEVQAKIQKYWKDNRIYGDPNKLNGEGIYGSIQAAALGNSGARSVNRNAAAEAASMDLNYLGIPGIRYLDGMSRGAGEGSMNYVMFDDALPRILEINNQPTGLLPWAANEWKGLLR